MLVFVSGWKVVSEVSSSELLRWDEVEKACSDGSSFRR